MGKSLPIFEFVKSCISGIYHSPVAEISYSLRSKIVASFLVRNPLQDSRGSHCNSRYNRPPYFLPGIHNVVIILEWREYNRAMEQEAIQLIEFRFRESHK